MHPAAVAKTPTSPADGQPAMLYLVRHVPPGGASVAEAFIEGASADEITQRLNAEGTVVVAIRPRRGVTWRRPGRFDVAWWCREFETLLRAGMTPVEALETLAAGRNDGDRRGVHLALLKSLSDGVSLSRAMRASGAFPEVLIAGVTASERTSTLADALRDHLRYDEMLETLRRKAASAALYPALVVAIGVVIAAFLLLFVIPRFARMYGSLHTTLSPATEAVLAVSRALSEQGPLWASGALLLTVAAAAVLRRAAVLRIAERLLEWVPALRSRWDQFRLAKLYQSLALLFRGGYTFDEALGVCAGLQLGPRMTAGLAGARAQIAMGKSASSAMAGAGLADLTSQRLLAVGERTGSFDNVLQTIADRHASRFAVIVERATRIVEPLLLLAVALVVGGLVVMMYMPIFDIAGGLGANR